MIHTSLKFNLVHNLTLNTGHVSVASYQTTTKTADKNRFHTFFIVIQIHTKWRLAVRLGHSLQLIFLLDGIRVGGTLKYKQKKHYQSTFNKKRQDPWVNLLYMLWTRKKNAAIRLSLSPWQRWWAHQQDTLQLSWCSWKQLLLHQCRAARWPKNIKHQQTVSDHGHI